MQPKQPPPRHRPARPSITVGGEEPPTDWPLVCSLMFIALSTLGLLGGFVVAIARRCAGGG